MMNNAAEQLIGVERVVLLARCGTLCAARPEDDAGLQAAHARAVRSGISMSVRLISQTSGRAFVGWFVSGKRPSCSLNQAVSKQERQERKKESFRETGRDSPAASAG